jgi:hypothetical protein
MQIADRCRLNADQLRARLADVRAGARRAPARGRPARTGDTAARAARPDTDGGSGDGSPGPTAPSAGTASSDADGGPRRHGSTNGRPEAASPEVEALRLAVHRPETVAPFLEELLFADEVNRAAFLALSASETLHTAIETAAPEAAALLRRLAVEEAEAEPGDVVALLVRLAVMRALADVEVDARASQTAVDLTWPKQRLEDLGDDETRVEASEQLVAWLVRSAEEGA